MFTHKDIIKIKMALGAKGNRLLGMRGGASADHREQGTSFPCWPFVLKNNGHLIRKFVRNGAKTSHNTSQPRHLIIQQVSGNVNPYWKPSSRNHLV